MTNSPVLPLPALLQYMGVMQKTSSFSSCRSSRLPLRVIVSLDVEEEGLFSGRYASRDCRVTNVQRLTSLAPLSDELGFPLTLFCSYTVLTDPAAEKVLETMRDRHSAEIGAHLHHWSTPPFDMGETETPGEPVRTDRMPPDLLKARMESLLQAGRTFQGAPLTSFRMGRWDLKAKLLPLLHELGIRVDSSICPLRRFKGGADDFLAPAVPWWPLGRETDLLELPITQIPLIPGLPSLWYRLFRDGPWLDRFHFLAAVSMNPFWHGDRVMRLAARLCEFRGIPVLNLFWHSSELMPGASPHVPDENAARNVLARIHGFLAWLRKHCDVVGTTASRLADEARTALDIPGHALHFPERGELGYPGGDW